MPYSADLDIEDLLDNELQYGAVCGLHGNRCDFTSLRAGINTQDIRQWDEFVIEDEDADHDTHLADPEMQALWIRLLRLLTLVQYRRSGKFTDIQIRTMYLAWVYELGLREIARLENKAPETIRQRIEGTNGHGGLKQKAPEFFEYWSRKNLKRKLAAQPRKKGTRR